jgi:hypothetical protein
METDWQRRALTLHETSTPSSLSAPLPGIAELLASPRPTPDSIPAYYQHQQHHQRRQPSPTTALPSASRSTPPSAPVLSTAANAYSSSEQSPFAAATATTTAVHHASQASPTESATSTTPSDRHHYHQPTAQPAAFSFMPTAKSEAYQSLQDASPSEAPINARRQDSAISQQRFETSKDGLPFVPLSESNFPYSQQSPKDARPSTSPVHTSHAASQSSPLLPPPPPATHIASTSTWSHEHVDKSSAPLQSRTATDSSFRRINSSQTPDHTNSTNTRQRYNVRFAANHTPANMPAAQRSRHSPPMPAAPSPSTEVVESSTVPPLDEHVAPPIEPAIQAITRSLKHSDESLQSDARTSESSAERCPRCNETWSRPLPSASEWGRVAPAESAKDLARASENFIAQMRQYGKDADQKYEQWKEKHSRCPIIDHRDSESRLYGLASQETSHSNDPNGHTQGTGHAQPSTNKRKSEISHDEASKLQKVSHDAHATTAPLVRPSSLT